MERCTKTAKMLLPKDRSKLEKWPVIACDQYTSQPEYWQKADEIAGENPSALRVVLPEVYLEDTDVEERIGTIHEAMEAYVTDGVLEELPEGMMLVVRDTGREETRKGIVMAFDLEAYDYKEGSASLIRPTEKTVESRIPPRLKVRRGAGMELPHIMLLIDDPEETVIEPVYAKREQLKKEYDVELMLGGGQLTGYFIPAGEETDRIQKALDAFYDRALFRKKYNLEEDLPLLVFASGDGNHSMATAKASWEEIRETLTEEERETHPARYVLAELVNVHDKSLEIEAIYRVLFGVDSEVVLKAAKEFYEAAGCQFIVCDGPISPDDDLQVFPWRAEGKGGVFAVRNPAWALSVATLQAFLDDFVNKNKEIRIDYIHGADTLEDLSNRPGNMGFILEDPAKSDLFKGVIIDGVLPRKTFSMGNAEEKRYYMEARLIQ